MCRAGVVGSGWEHNKFLLAPNVQTAQPVWTSQEAVITLLTERLQDLVGAMFTPQVTEVTYDDASGKIEYHVPLARLVMTTTETVPVQFRTTTTGRSTV